MSPFPVQNADEEQRVYNYRHSRAAGLMKIHLVFWQPEGGFSKSQVEQRLRIWKVRLWRAELFTITLD